MKTIMKELNLLDIEDIEQAISKHFDQKVAVSEVECTLVYCIPVDSREPNGAYLDFTIGEDSCDSFDVLYDDELNGHYLNGKRLSLDEPWLPAEEIFNFDVSAFKSFETFIDGSD